MKNISLLILIYLYIHILLTIMNGLLNGSPWMICMCSRIKYVSSWMTNVHFKPLWMVFSVPSWMVGGDCEYHIEWWYISIRLREIFQMKFYFSLCNFCIYIYIYKCMTWKVLEWSFWMINLYSYIKLCHREWHNNMFTLKPSWIVFFMSSWMDGGDYEYHSLWMLIHQYEN